MARFRPRHPTWGIWGARAVLPAADLYLRRKHFFRPCSRIAAEKRQLLSDALARGETAYLAGIGVGGVHNTGVALVEVDPSEGPRILCNNEEERFSGCKHTNLYPSSALDALLAMIRNLGIAPNRIAAWLGTFDYPMFAAASMGVFLDEFPASFDLRFQDPVARVDFRPVKDGLSAPRRLAALFGLDAPVPVIGMPHHDNHASFAYCVSPFARDDRPVMIVVSDGAGDCASVSRYIGVRGAMRLIGHNGSLFDSIGGFYSVISATQGGWTFLSSEGRYMGAAGYGDMDRASNPYYSRLRNVFSFEPDRFVRLNRSLANWHRSFRRPYSLELTGILGRPIEPRDRWNPDAVLRVEDIRHEPHTQDRVDKAAATQLVFEDALFHVIDCFIRGTGSDRLVLSGGAALNALANMHLIERFDEDYYVRVLGQRTRLHLWTPPTPGDAGATLGAAYSFALSAGVSPGAPLQHAFYCGRGSSCAEWTAALRAASDVEWLIAGDARGDGIDAIADLMAAMTASDAVIGLIQGAAETGPRALGHRSILANARNPLARELINERVKYRERIRPLAPMATLRAAKDLFELSEGASDDDYNAYNYMVITVRAKAEARRLVPAVVHVDGTARIQIVRRETDPIAYAYLEAVGRRLGVEVAVNTSFNVGAPIAQTPAQVIETMLRAKAMDGVFIFADGGPVLLASMRKRATAYAACLADRLARATRTIPASSSWTTAEGGQDLVRR